MSYNKDVLNGQVLLPIRKIYGMWGGLHWRVENTDDSLINIVASAGRHTKVQDEARVGNNIISSIQHILPDSQIELTWVDWQVYRS